jgi:hypothetical protein
MIPIMYKMVDTTYITLQVIGMLEIMPETTFILIQFLFDFKFLNINQNRADAYIFIFNFEKNKDNVRSKCRKILLNLHMQAERLAPGKLQVLSQTFLQ